MVIAFDSSDHFAGTTSTNSTGGYTVSGLAAGTYEVEFSGGNYLPQFFDGKSSLASADPVTVTAGMTTPGINATLQPGGQITGTVTDATTSSPIQHVPVDAYDSIGVPVASACTAADGTYTLSGLANGTYHVGFAPFSFGFGGPCGTSVNYLPQFYNDKSSVLNADPVAVTAGMTTPGINAALQPGGKITGKATDATTTSPIQNVTVEAYNSAGLPTAFACTAADGTYALSGLSTGTYHVGFAPTGFGFSCLASLNYLPQFYNDKSSLASADPVAVTAGMTTPGIDAALQPGGKITGKVTDASTTNAIQNVPVQAYNSSGAVVATACTAADGTYTLPALASGTYHVGFATGICGASLNYLPQFYNDKSSLASADPVAVTAGMTTPGIDAALQPGGKITGKVTDASTTNPVQNVLVQAYNSSGAVVATTCTAADGTYTLSGLPSGTYHVGFTPGSAPPFCFGSGGYLPQFYNDKSSLASADPVAVTAGMTTPGINAALQPGGKITGKVTDATTTNAIQNVPVQAYNSSGAVVATTCTAADGTYTLSGLPSGTYHVGFTPGSAPPFCFGSGGYLPQFYNDKSSLASADPVAVTAGMTTPGINAALQPGGKITGKVTDATTTNAIQNVPVQAYNSTGAIVGTACTAADGTYTLSGLPSGTYHVGFAPSGFSFFCFATLNYLPQYYNDKSSLASADPVTVTAGMTTPGINAALQPGGKITGKVTDVTTTSPIPNVEVDVYNSSGTIVGTACTALDGTYTLSGLVAGTYHVGFAPSAFSFVCFTSPNYVPQYYNDKLSLASADPVTVTAGMTTPGINAALTGSMGTHTLTVSLAGTGSGSVTGTGITCPSTCTHDYTSGTTVTLTAAPASGSTFAGWSGGGCTGTGTCTVTMSSDQTVTATFTAVGTHTLTVSPAGTGSGTVTGTGIDCPGTCTHDYTSGTTVTLTAAPASGSTFAGWSGGGCSGTGTCTVTMSSDQTVTATFDTTTVTHTLTVSPAGTGSGTVTGTGIDCPGTCTHDYTSGTTVTLTAAPASGSTFAGWSGGGCSGTGTCTVTMSSDQTVTATFNTTTVTHTLTVSPAGTGSGTVTDGSAINCPGTCTHDYPSGTTVTLTAAPASGSTFAGWSGGGCSGTGTCTVTMSSDQTVTATFNTTPVTHTLTVSLAGTGSGTVTGTGIACPSTCTHDYPSGTTVTLTAAPASGSTFAGWSGGGCSGTGTCTVTMSSDQTVTATFNTTPVTQTLTVSLAGAGSGTVTGTGISCPSTCTHSYTSGTTVALTAAPASGSIFAGWSGGGCTGTATCTITMNTNQTVTATFFSAGQIKALLSQAIVPHGKKAKIPAILKAGGYTVTFTALTGGVLTIRWYLVPHGAHLSSGKSPKPVLVATGKRTFSQLSIGKLKVKLTAAGKRLLKHAKSIKLTVKASFTPTGSAPVRVLKKFRLKR